MGLSGKVIMKLGDIYTQHLGVEQERLLKNVSNY